jgi:hypothetical protein
MILATAFVGLIRITNCQHFCVVIDNVIQESTVIACPGWWPIL